MILEKPLPYWNSPPPTLKDWTAIGQHAVEAWRRKFRAEGLRKVISASRAAYNPPALQRVRADLATLRRQVDQTAPGSLERVQAEQQVKGMEEQVAVLANEAGGASHAVFRQPESVRLLKDDVARFVEELERAVEDWIEAYRELHLRMGWDEPPVEYLGFGSAPIVALNALLEGAGRRELARFEHMCELAEKGEKIPADFRVEDITWHLAGMSWQDCRDRWQM